MPKEVAGSSVSVALAAAKVGPAPNMIREDAAFLLPTGDTYSGGFEAKKKEKIVKMFGSGMYTTAQGDRYFGIWANDQLVPNEAMTASYHDGSRYLGPVTDWKYTGLGQYFYPDGTELSCSYVNNCPVGDLTLTDPNIHKWLGHAETGFAWFYPVNHYYNALAPGKEKKIKKKESDFITLHQ